MFTFLIFFPVLQTGSAGPALTVRDTASGLLEAAQLAPPGGLLDTVPQGGTN
jgi:hypothetical protein